MANLRNRNKDGFNIIGSRITEDDCVKLCEKYNDTLDWVNSILIQKKDGTHSGWYNFEDLVELHIDKIDTDNEKEVYSILLVLNTINKIINHSIFLSNVLGNSKLETHYMDITYVPLQKLVFDYIIGRIYFLIDSVICKDIDLGDGEYSREITGIIKIYLENIQIKIARYVDGLFTSVSSDWKTDLVNPKYNKYSAKEFFNNVKHKFDLFEIYLSESISRDNIIMHNTLAKLNGRVEIEEFKKYSICSGNITDYYIAIKNINNVIKNETIELIKNINNIKN